MGAANQEILENIFKVKEHIPVFIGDFGDDPYCNVKNENYGTGWKQYNITM